MAFQTVTPIKAEKKLSSQKTVTLNFERDCITFSSALYRKLELDKYPHITLAFDQETSQLAILRGSQKKTSSVRVNSSSRSVRSPAIMRGVKRLIPNYTSSRLKYSVEVRPVREIMSAIISLNAPMVNEVSSVTKVDTPPPIPIPVGNI